MTFNFGSMVIGVIVGILIGMVIEYISWISKLKKKGLFDKEGNLKKGDEK